ncbi:hypothetical protein ASF43_10420 [Pseudorhodoferax sp. Leaf267]|nr:hypothetical protein ASF43_10420 [Pseudorhodoferax sp. Leaf267]
MGERLTSGFRKSLIRWPRMSASTSVWIWSRNLNLVRISCTFGEKPSRKAMKLSRRRWPLLMDCRSVSVLAAVL